MHFGLGKMPAVEVASLFIHTHHIALCIPYIPGAVAIGGFAYPVAAGIVGIAYGVAVFLAAKSPCPLLKDWRRRLRVGKKPTSFCRRKEVKIKFSVSLQILRRVRRLTH
jgi:hypothetical protein